jgi:hypothetical protein
MPVFSESVEVRSGWGDWIVLAQLRDTQAGRFLIHNPWGNSNQPQGAADRNRLEVGYRNAAGLTQWAQLVLHGPSGNIGVGIPNPSVQLHVRGRIATGQNMASAGAVTFFPPDGFAWFHIDNGPSSRPMGRLRISHGNAPGASELVSILQNGRVGIGTATPRERLEVNGSVAVTGDVRLLGADCAEQFVSDGAPAEPGSVVVLGDEGDVRLSEAAYDRRVVGVVSGAGSVRPGIVLGTPADESRAEPRLTVALVGKVFCKVDAAEAPVAVGDLLTTAERPGHAMKAEDPERAFGAVIGKALRPLAEGQGLVPILVALQ